MVAKSREPYLQIVIHLTYKDINFEIPDPEILAFFFFLTFPILLYSTVFMSNCDVIFYVSAKLSHISKLRQE